MEEKVSTSVLEGTKQILVKDKPKRTLVIGDIHGGYKALVQVMQRSKFNIHEDLLICLGDYVDGWSETAEVIQYLIELESQCVYKPIFLRGNHDSWAEEWFTYGTRKDIWVMQGGQATIDSYIRTGLVTNALHKSFFQRLHNYYVDEENRGFVHGGFISKNGLGHEVYQSDYYWDRDLWGLALLQHGKKLDNMSVEAGTKLRRFEKHKEVYIGHTSTANWNVKPHLPEYQYAEQPKQGPILVPMNRCNVWNMDTGGGFGGRLTMMDIDTKEFWQSDNLKDLYPDERGR